MKNVIGVLIGCIVMGLGLGLLLSVIVPVDAHAWEKGGNPDRFPSIGVELAKGQVAGIPKAGINGAQTNGGTVGFLGDFKFPVTQSLTLHTSFQTDGINNNLAYTDGYRLAVGLRVYLKD